MGSPDALRTPRPEYMASPPPMLLLGFQGETLQQENKLRLLWCLNFISIWPL